MPREGNIMCEKDGCCCGKPEKAKKTVDEYDLDDDDCESLEDDDDDDDDCDDDDYDDDED